MSEHFPRPYDHEAFVFNSEVLGELSIDQLPERLGFIETEEMCELHAGYVAARLSGEADIACEMVAEYHLLGQRVVEQYKGDALTRAQIGLTIGLALLRREVSVIDSYIDDLNDAIDYASNMNYSDIVESLETAKSNAVADILRDIGEEYGFDAETCNEIAAQPFDEAFESAYSCLLQAGLDPDSVLDVFKEA
jgi:hypothetical protein